MYNNYALPMHIYIAQDKSATNYCIYENSFGTCERMVEITERPLKRIQELSEVQ